MGDKEEIRLLRIRLEPAQATDRTCETLFSVMSARLRALTGAPTALPEKNMKIFIRGLRKLRPRQPRLNPFGVVPVSSPVRASF